MFVTAFVLSILVTCVSLAPLCNSTVSSNTEVCPPFNNAEPDMQLYNSIIVGDYNTAVKTTFKLENADRSDVISTVVNRLLQEGKTNILDYAYSLWNRFGECIVKIYFPIEFRLMLNESPVMIINKRDELALKLELKTDNAGDRASSGAGSVNVKHPVPRVSWKLLPVWDKNKVYFKILNTYHTQYLKLEVKADSAGDHTAFGANEEDTWRHEWYFHPVVHNNEILFYMMHT